MFYKFKCKVPCDDKNLCPSGYDTAVGLVCGKDIHEAMDNVMEYMTVNGEEDLIYVLLEPWGTNIVPLSKEALNKVEKEYVF